MVICPNVIASRSFLILERTITKSRTSWLIVHDWNTSHLGFEVHHLCSCCVGQPGPWSKNYFMICASPLRKVNQKSGLQLLDKKLCSLITHECCDFLNTQTRQQHDIRNCWGAGPVEPQGESWLTLRDFQTGVCNRNFGVWPLLLDQPTATTVSSDGS